MDRRYLYLGGFLFLIVILVLVFSLFGKSEPIPSPEQMSIEEARSIAQNTECTQKGELTDSFIYNENSKTWWIDLEMKPEFENPICSPACVISEDSKSAEINWRCTGLIQPNENE